MWKLIYAHDVHGNQVEGEHAHLVNAVLRGQPLRVLFDVAEDDVAQAAGHNCAAVFLKHGYVFGQISFAVSEWMNGEKDLLRFSTGNLIYVMNLSTSGHTHARLIDGTNGTYTENDYRHAVRWFVEA